MGQRKRSARLTPIELHPLKDQRRSAFLQQIDSFWPLNRNLSEVVGNVFDRAIELAGMVAHPVEIFFAGAGVNHQQVFILAKVMDNHIVHESPLGVKAAPSTSLADGQSEPRTRSFIEMCCTAASQACGPARFRIISLHVTDVEDAHASPNGIVLGHNAARGWVFNRHIPAVEFDHFGTHLAMHRIESGLTDGGSGFNCGQRGAR